MKAIHLETLAQQIGPLVREYVARVVGGYAKRLEDLETRPALPGPAGERGVSGESGARGEKGLDGAPGKDGRDGLPGVPGGPGAQGERGERGEKGIDGAAGRDGTVLGLKALAAAMRPASEDGGRTLTWVWADGSPVEGWVIKTAVPIYRKQWQEGQLYQQGDQVTYSNSTWTALAMTDAKPGESSEASRAWHLTLKRGEQGKPGAKGIDGKDGKDGRPGMDLTQRDAQGHKW